MRRALLVILLALLALPLSSCARFYAGLVSSKVVSDQRSLKSYSGRYVEQYAVTDGAERVRVVKEVLFEAPWSVRIEVVEPPEHAGELVVYDGQTMSMWFPRERVGVRIDGAEAPTPAEIRSMLTDDTLWAWQSYAFSYRGKTQHEHRPVSRWKASPKRRQDLLYPYEAWTDLQYSLPLRVQIDDGPHHRWYSMAFERIEFDQPVPAGSFDFDFPQDATVLSWDLRAPGVPEEQLREQLDFDLLVPTKLPEGLRVQRMIRGDGGLPVATLLMDDGGRWLSLTESHAFGRALEPGAGIPIEVGAERGFLNLMGNFSSVSWYAGGTALTLVGNLPYPEMVELAASIEPPAAAAASDVLALEGYRGRLVERCPSCPDPVVVKQLRYRAPGHVEVEVLEPTARAGERFVYDGETVTMYWPQEQLGMRIRGPAAPSVDQLRQLLRQDGVWALQHYQHHWEGREEQAGREASHWRSEPRADGLRAHDTWLDRATALPLKWTVDDGEQPWFSTEIEALELADAGDPFDTDFPPETLVIDWDLSAPGTPIDAVRAELNFDLLLPDELPAGLSVQRVIHHPEYPVVTVMMGRDARWLSLTESRHFGGPPLARSGIPIELPGGEARLELSGSFAALSWSLGGTALTLVGNLPYQEMIRVAGSVQPAEDGLEVQDLLALERFSADSIERYAGASQPVEKRILQADGRVRVELRSPGRRRGELFLYDGESLSMWWPQHLLGVRIRGAQAPTVEQQRAGLAAGALWTLRSYRLDYEGLEDRDGRPTERWSAQPRGDDPLLFPYRAWLDRELSLPLAVQMDDGQGQELYRMELRGLDLVPEIAEDAFALRFPRNAVVFEYDLGDPHQPLPDLARGMNFELLAPSHLPDGFELRRAVRGRHMLPTALLVLDDGQRWLSLSESRRMPGGLDQSQGLPVRVGEHDGVLVFAGSFSSLSWTQGDTALTLVGQLPYPELLAVAASMVSVTPGIRG